MSKLSSNRDLRTELLVRLDETSRGSVQNFMPQPPTAPAGKPQSAGSVSGELSLGSYSLPVTHIKGGTRLTVKGKK